MGIFGKDDATPSRTFMMREKLMGLGNDYWIKVEVGDQEAVVRKQLIGIGEKYNVEMDGKNLKVKGDIIGHEYTIERDGDAVAEISRKHFHMRDTYGIEVLGDVDPALVISVAVAVEKKNEKKAGTSYDSV